MPEADFAALDAVGLNLRAVFALDQLPDALRDALRNECDAARNYSQLLLIGNGGRAMWQAILREGGRSADPIDDFSVRAVRRWLAAQASGRSYEIVYPGERLVGLQSLGECAGWHFASPFMVGINERWGTWFAYRVAVLADTDFEPTRPVPGESPCTACRPRPCVSACPGKAIESDEFNLANCVRYRLRADSACQTTCMARPPITNDGLTTSGYPSRSTASAASSWVLTAQPLGVAISRISSRSENFSRSSARSIYLF